MAILGFLGFQRGFLKESLSIALTLFALLFSIGSWEILTVPVGLFMDPQTPGFGMVCGTVLFLLILGVGSLIIFGLVKMVDRSALSVVNRLLGLLFGALKGAVIVSIILQLLAPFGSPDSKSKEASYVYPIVFQTGPMVYDAFMTIVPEARTFAEKVSSSVKELNGETEPSK